MKSRWLLPFLLIAVFAIYGCGELALLSPKDNASSSEGNNSGNGGDSGDDGTTDDGTGENPGGGTGENPGDGTGGTDGGYNPKDPTYDIEPVTGPIKMVVAGVYDGIYYSTDGLTGWTKATGKNGLNLAKSRWVSFADLGGGTVVAGSGDLQVVDFDAPGQGIIISHDYGKTWEPTSQPLGQWQALAYMGNNIVLAGATNAAAVLNGGGVWRSEDGGKTWAQNTDEKGGPYPKFNLAFPPSSSNKGKGLNYGIVRAITRLSDTSAILSGGTNSCEGGPCPVKITFDAGKTWFSALDQPATNNINAFLKAKDGRILSANYGAAGISHTLDNNKTGISWSPQNDLIRRSFVSLAQLKSGTILAGNLQDQNVTYGKSSGIYIGSIDIWGLYFTQSNQKQYEWKAIEALEDPNTAIAGCAEDDKACQGIYKSTDNGMNWSPSGLNGINVLAIKSLR